MKSCNNTLVEGSWRDEAVSKAADMLGRLLFLLLKRITQMFTGGLKVPAHWLLPVIN